MVMNSNMVVGVAHLSARLCQEVACNPETLPTDQALDLICCLPLRQLGRLLLSLWTYLCFDPSPSYYLSSSSSDDDDDDSDDPGSDLDDRSHPHLN